MKMKVIFKPYCSFAMMGDSDRKVKRRRLTAIGRGTMSDTKITISKTRRRNTWAEKSVRWRARELLRCAYEAVVERHFDVGRIVAVWGGVV